MADIRDEAINGFKELGSTESKENYDLFQTNKSARAPWMTDRIENDNFYHNVQYTPTEEADIIARGQAPLRINVTYSIIKQIISFLTGTMPTWVVYPVADSNKELSYLYRGILESIWYNSRGSRKFQLIAKDTCVAGVGYGYVNPTYNPNFTVEFSHVPYGQVYIAPNASDVTYEDADNIIISKLMTHKNCANFFGKTKEDVEEWSTSDFNDLDEGAQVKYANNISPSDKTKFIRVIQRLEMEDTDLYIVRPVKDAKTKQRVYFKKTEELIALEASGLVICEKVRRRILHKYLSAGDHCEKYTIPITSYNIRPFIDEFRNNPYPMGTVDFLYGLQRALNKFILLSILNATLSNNMRMIAPKGTIDKADYIENYSKPGYLVEYEWTDKDQPVPKEQQPSALPASFFEFPMRIISIMEYISGIFGVMMGNPQGAPDTVGGMTSLQGFGGQKIKLLTRNMADALSGLGDVTIELFQNYSPYNQQISYVDNNEKLQQLQLNTLSVNNGSIEINNDLSAGRYKTRVLIQPDYGSERQAKATVLANLASQTRSPGLIRPILKLADIPEADKIADEVDQVAQAEQSVQQMQEQVQRLTQINQQLQNEIVQKAQKVEVTEFRANLDELYNRIEKELGVKLAQETAKLKVDISKEIANFKMKLNDNIPKE